VKLFRRPPKPAPKPVDPAAVAVGLRAYAADLEAGLPLAVELATHPYGEMPVDGRAWAAYPADPYRLERLADLSSETDL